jgi:hypothetical protein
LDCSDITTTLALEKGPSRFSLDACAGRKSPARMMVQAERVGKIGEDHWEFVVN